MQENNQIGGASGRRPIDADAEDLAKLLNYPAVGELFSGSDPRRLDDFCGRLRATRDELERVVRRGTRAEAESAQRAARGIEVTLEFLESLRKMQLAQRK